MLHAQPQQDSILQRHEVPDGLLVRQVLAGDQRAFELLVKRYHHRLVNYIQNYLKDYDGSYDILQQVYLQLYLSLPILLTNGSLKCWLFRVARNRCLDELRKRHRRPAVPFSALEREGGEEELSSLEAILDWAPLPEEITESNELNETLHMAIRSLPPKLRLIVHLRSFKYLTFAEIGRLLNMPETTAKTYYYRSLPLLRDALVSDMPCASIS